MNAYIRYLIPLIFIAMLPVSPVNAQEKNAANHLLAHTINMGYTFDAPKEGAWGNTLLPSDFTTIKAAGFTAVRLPVQWVARMDIDTPYSISPEFLKRIDEVVQQALNNHLAIILENCLDAQLMANPEKYKARFLSLWTQLAAHYAARPDQVFFEIMAEPHGALDPLWNTYLNEALAIIRKTNPVRPVIIGPRFSNMPYYLNELQLSENDPNLIVTFHLYKPLTFTMQGEAWFPIGKPMEWIGTKWTGTVAEQKEITDQLDVVSAWAIKNKRPIFMGEFGAGNHADPESKARFLTYYREQAERRNFSWGVWSYTTGFALFDKTTGKWHPEFLQALIPQ